MTKKQTEKQIVNRVFMYICMVAAIALLIIGGLALWANQFATNMVRTELAAQKIYFPAKGTPALDPEVYPDLQKYAGELVDTPQEAKAYANGYIGRHLKKIADGKVYAEVSAAAQQDPTNQKLQQQKSSLFQGETLRGILLGTGYAFGTIGNIAGIAARIAFFGSIAAILGAIYLGTRRY